MFEQLGLIGCGLMGGSFALALKRAGLVKRVVGYSKSPSTTERAAPDGRDRRRGALGAAGRVRRRHRAAGGAGGGHRSHAQGDPAPGHQGHADHGRRLDQARRDRLPPAACCATTSAPSCPATRSPARKCPGVEHADPDLYTGKQVILTPIDRTDAEPAAEAPSTVWEALGCQVLQMAPEAHDAAFAAVSHLPHLHRLRADQRDRRPAAGQGIPVARRARAFATSRASPPAIPRCGATSCWPTGTNCWPSRRSSSARLHAMELLIESGNGEALEDADRAGQRGARALAHGRVEASDPDPAGPGLMFATEFLDIPPLRQRRRHGAAARLQEHFQPRAAAGRAERRARPPSTTCSIRTTPG